MSIYDEAIVESKKLKEIAEQNAKNRIIEAVSPKIKELIEKQLLGEDVSNDDSDILQGDPEEDEETGEEFTLSTESAKLLAGILKEENIAENIELEMLRLYNKLQLEVTKENRSVKSLNLIKNDILTLAGRLKENKENIKEEEFGKFDKNLSYLFDSANKVINSQISKTFDAYSKQLETFVSNKKLKKEAKKVKAQKIIENVKKMCSFINENKLISEKKDFDVFTKKLNLISKTFKKI